MTFFARRQAGRRAGSQECGNSRTFLPPPFGGFCPSLNPTSARRVCRCFSLSVSLSLSLTHAYSTNFTRSTTITTTRLGTLDASKRMSDNISNCPTIDKRKLPRGGSHEPGRLCPKIPALSRAISLANVCTSLRAGKRGRFSRCRRYYYLNYKHAECLRHATGRSCSVHVGQYFLLIPSSFLSFSLSRSLAHTPSLLFCLPTSTRVPSERLCLPLP